MRKLQELVKEAKTAIEKVNGELFAMSTNGGPNTYERDATLVAAELKGLRERHNNQAETIRDNIREKARIRTILGAKPSETTEQAAARVMKPGGKMALAVTNLRKARNEVREILGARPGEGSRAAARRVVSQLEKQPIDPKTSSRWATVFHVYNELDEMAQRAGYPPGSVGAFVRRLSVGKKTYAE